MKVCSRCRKTLSGNNGDVIGYRTGESYICRECASHIDPEDKFYCNRDDCEHHYGQGQCKLEFCSFRSKFAWFWRDD